MMRFMVLLLSVMFAPVAMAQDPVATDGDKYKVLLENDTVRVLDYLDRPGEKTTQHHHPDFVLYALTPFKRRLTLGNGAVITREFKAGDVMWSPAQTHIGENIGATDTHVIIVEMKSKAASTNTEKEAASKPAGK